jgi:hypothetical protein
LKWPGDSSIARARITQRDCKSLWCKGEGAFRPVASRRFAGEGFYVGCPAIQIDDWGNLEAEVKALTADPQRLLDLHRETVAWWRTKLSEPAIGSLIAKCLESPGTIEESPA